jgi:hypothetical protein
MIFASLAVKATAEAESPQGNPRNYSLLSDPPNPLDTLHPDLTETQRIKEI